MIALAEDFDWVTARHQCSAPSAFVRPLQRPVSVSIGTVEGMLQGLITHGKNRFLIFDPLSGRQVTCYFSDRIPYW